MSVPKIPHIAVHAPSGGRTMLYRFYDASGDLLYVGITDNPRDRWAAHERKNKDGWWGQVVVVHTEWYPTRPEAEAAEIAAIQSEEPAHNVSHYPKPRGWRRLSSMYLHPMARDHFGDRPFTYWDLSDELGIPYGTVAVYGRRLVEEGAFKKVGEQRTSARSRRALFIAV